MKIEKHEGEHTIEVKRFYFPFTVTSQCPRCGAGASVDGREEYVSYPVLGGEEDLTFCREECGKNPNQYCEWSEKVVFELSLRPTARRAGGQGEG